jgi:drug/metabolite transporter (DMT)-like permease
VKPKVTWSEQGRGALLGLGAAALFGLSAPLAKLLLGAIAPVRLAGLLYLGAAAGLWLHRAWGAASREAKLAREDLVPLGLVVVLGGILGPVLMLLGLRRVSALTGSLLLNLEAPLTVLFAVALFGEHLGRSALLAVVFILSGASLLDLESGTGPGFAADWLGGALLAAACACWALDNNLTQRLSLRDPFAIVRIKTLVAGVVNTLLGFAFAGSSAPPLAAVAGALVLGSASYGLSVVADAYALRLVGAAREAAYFATAPFVGACVSVAVLGDPLRARDLAALGCMVAGVIFLARERHSHEHEHEALEHAHLHRHDAHHQHIHAAGDPGGDPHSHVHRHQPVVHEHPHVPDAHHRHKH